MNVFIYKVLHDLEHPSFPMFIFMRTREDWQMKEERMTCLAQDEIIGQYQSSEQGIKCLMDPCRIAGSNITYQSSDLG